MSEYTDNILGQPGALEALLAQLDLGALQQLGTRVQAGEYDRIILTGMGASLCAAYPAWTLLAQAGLPAWWLETGELGEVAPRLVTPKSLLWMVSQAGKGPEALGLLDDLAERRPGLVLATTNEPESPLAARADAVLPLLTAREHGVATRSFVNTLAVTQLAALAMTGQPLAPALAALRDAAQSLADYLHGWEQKVESFATWLPHPDRILLVGRGGSLAAALDGALTLKEAARANAEGLSASQFRHGPLELADDRLTAIVLEGDGPQSFADYQLARTVIACGGHALWLGASPAADGAVPDGTPPVPALPAPVGRGLARPIAQIVPIQLLSLYLAQLGGFAAADFRHLGKVTWPKRSRE